MVLVAIGSKPNGAAIMKRVPWMHHSQIQNQEGSCVCAQRGQVYYSHWGDTIYSHVRVGFTFQKVLALAGSTTFS